MTNKSFLHITQGAGAPSSHHLKVFRKLISTEAIHDVSAVTRHLAMASIIILVGLLTSCHSSKRAYTGDVSAIDATDATTEHLFEALSDSYKPWEALYVPVTLSLISPNSMSISGRATMVYGEEINISLRMLGMEVGVLNIDKDKVYVVDKIHKVYFTEDISVLLSGIDISLKDLQDLLLGRAVIPGKGVVKAQEAKSFSFLASESQWLMTPVHQFKGAEWHYTATKTDPPLLSTISVRMHSGQAIECRFSEPTLTEAGIVDGICTLTLPFKSSDLCVSLTWDLDDAKWNTDRRPSFSAPSNAYKRIGLDSLLNMKF